MSTSGKLYWHYGEEEGATIEVVRVTLPPEWEALIEQLYLEPTNLTELPI